MDTELWANIRRLYEVEHLSQRAIALRLGLHRKTVRKALKYPTSLGYGDCFACREGPPPCSPERRVLKASKLEPYKNYVTNRLKSYPELSAKKLLIEIKKQGYTGSYAILRDYLRTIRPKKTQVFLRLETLPGEFAQVDWANVGKILVGNATRIVSAFVMVLSYSRMMFLEFTLSQCIEDFMQCHVDAFNFFGGCPKKINYDNLKTVVLSRINREIKFNSKFLDFCGYYLFEPVPCGVRQAHEKGKVENGIKYVRSSFLAGFELVDFKELTESGRNWLENEANLRIHGTTRQRPIDRFQIEKPHLMALPQKPYDCSIILPVQSSSQALIHFQANRYSVPFAFANKTTLTLKATPQTVHIYENSKLLTIHPRCYEKHRIIERPEHYEGLLAERKKARESKLIESFQTIAPECSEYLKGLVQTEIHLPSHLEKIVKLAQVYSKSEMVYAIAHALKYNAFGAHYIQNILLQQRALKNLPKPEPIVLLKKPHWTQLTVEQTDLAVYDELFEQGTDLPTEDSPHEPKP